MPTATETACRAASAALCLLLVCALAACGGGGGRSPRSYTVPGSAEDPWGPYISEAAGRFQVPETWVRAVMRQESGGKQYIGGRLTTSSAGAAGLMQVMPATYEELRRRYNLGSDPYDPHDNIMAGTGYIREMYDRYGAPNFLAAYNAGPRRVDDYLASGSALPAETVNYVAAIGPRLGAGGGGPRPAYAAADRRSTTIVMARMEPIASPGDPGMPAAAPPQLVEQPQLVARMAPIASPGDPGMPAPETVSRMPPIASPGDPGIPPIVAAVARAPLGAPVAGLPPPPTSFGAHRSPPPGFLTVPVTHAASAPASGGYGIQVGAYTSPSEARLAADAARALTGATAAGTAIGPASRPDGRVLFRARLVGMSPDQAAGACQRLAANGKPCFVVPPEAAS